MLRYLYVFSLLLIVSCSYIKEKNSIPNQVGVSVNSESQAIPDWTYCYDNTCVVASENGEKELASDQFLYEVAFARFSDQISPDYLVDAKKIFAYGIAYKNKLAATMERELIGGDYNIYLYNYSTKDKSLVLNQSTFPQLKCAVKPIAFLNENELLLEGVILDDAFQHQGIWKYHLKTKALTKLPIHENYLSTPELSKDGRFLIYGAAHNVKPDYLHGNIDAVFYFDLKTNKETLLKEISGVLYNIGWKNKTTYPQSTGARSSVNLNLPWEPNIPYCVTRDGNSPPPAPIGSSTTCSNLGPHSYIAWDFDTPNNAQDKMLAAEAGVVTKANFAAGSGGWDPAGYGNWVIITHSNNYRTLYAHLSSVNVTVGQQVDKGCFIGYEGTTGSSSGDHLHMEYEFPGGTSGNTYTTFVECSCVPHRGYSYTSQNTLGTCVGVPPPNNDACPGEAITSSSTCNPVSGTIDGATSSFGPNQCAGCGCTSADDNDVYYNFVAVDTTHTITLDGLSNDFNGVIELRSACSFNTNLTCTSPTASGGPVTLTYNNFTVGQTYYIRIYERDNGATPPTSSSFTVCVTHSCQLPDTAGASITGNLNPCANTTEPYNVTPVAGATSYTWELPNGWTGTSTNPSIVANVGTTGGKIKVTPNNGCGSGETISVDVQVGTITANPEVQIFVSPGNYVSPGQTVSFIANNTNNIPGVNFQWYVNGALVASSVNYSTNTLSDGDEVVCKMDGNSGCGITLPVYDTIYINHIASVNDLAKDFISINPMGANQVKITLTEANNNLAVIQVFDDQGRMIQRVRSNDKTIMVDLSSEAKGSYIIQVAYAGYSLAQKVVSW